MPEFMLKGASEVIVNSEKGAQLLDMVEQHLVYRELSFDEGMQVNLQHPTEKPKKYDNFVNVLEDKGLTSAFWSIASTKEKVQFILNKLHLGEVIYRIKGLLK